MDFFLTRFGYFICSAYAEDLMGVAYSVITVTASNCGLFTSRE